jgi:hypothetical protein
MSGYDPHEWVEFGVAVAGAAAVLAGLVFVSVSINLEKVLEIHGLPGRAGESIVMFAGVLILSICLLMPGQSRTALGVELVVGGALLMTLLVLIALPGLNRPTRQPLSWRITRIVLALAASVPVILAGVSLLAEAGGGLYWLAAAFMLALAAGIANAWVLLVEVVRDERYLPVGGDDRQ